MKNEKDERSHSRISFYTVFRDWNEPIYISTFLKLRRADDWIEGYQYNERIIGFIAKIDGIEYHINKDGDIRDALKLHEAFYEKEYLTGEKREKKAEKKRKIGWYQLRGKGYYYNTCDKDVTRSYTRAKSLDVIAGCIVDIGIFSWDNKFLTGLVLRTPDGKDIELPNFKKVRQPDFYEVLSLTRRWLYSDSHYTNPERAHNAQLVLEREKQWRNQRIKNVRKVIDRSLKDDAETKRAA